MRLSMCKARCLYDVISSTRRAGKAGSGPIHTHGSGLVGMRDEPQGTGESGAELEPRAAGVLDRKDVSFIQREEGSLFLTQEKRSQGAAGRRKHASREIATSDQEPQREGHQGRCLGSHGDSSSWCQACVRPRSSPSSQRCPWSLVLSPPHFFCLNDSECFSVICKEPRLRWQGNLLIKKKSA